MRQIPPTITQSNKRLLNRLILTRRSQTQQIYRRLMLFIPILQPRKTPIKTSHICIRKTMHIRKLHNHRLTAERIIPFQHHGFFRHIIKISRKKITNLHILPKSPRPSDSRQKLRLKAQHTTPWVYMLVRIALSKPRGGLPPSLSSAPRR